MTLSHRIPAVLTLVALTSVPTVAFAAPSSTLAASLLAQDAKPVRYVRSASATKLFNVPDKTNGLAVAQVPASTLLAVYDDRSGWLSVEPPQGLTVWVYGQFLRPTSQPGIAEVTGDGVRMRPLPSSSKDSYPLENWLHDGDRVRVLGRDAADKPLREDWVKVVSPPGVRAWVHSADTTATETGLEVQRAWMDAVKSTAGTVALVDLKDGKAVTAGAPAAGTTAGGAAGVAVSDANAKPDAAPAQGTWDAAEARYEQAKGSSAADWTAVRAGFQGYLDKNPNGVNAGTAKLRLEQIGYHEEIARLKADAQLQETQRQKMLAQARAQLEEASLAQDPLWGRFQARGWLKRDEKDPTRWTVTWAGRPAAEITCGNGRYDLTLYEGSEIGVLGSMTRSSGNADKPMRIDAKRIEVISAAGGR